MSKDEPRTISTLGYPNREAVRIKVKKYEDDQEPEYRKFSVDPEITTYNILRCLLSRAFELKGEFAITYMAIDDFGEETFLALLSDWDLDAAFCSASDPYLHLRLEVRPFDSCPQWEAESTGIDLTQLRKPSVDLRSLPTAPSSRLLGFGNVINQVQNTFSFMSRALNMGDDRPPTPTAAPPLTDGQFHNYLDTVGRLVQPKELRVAIYRGGVEPTLRKVVWKHLLNIYPESMTARERIEYVKTKCTEYRDLRDTWMKMVQDGKVTDEIHQSTNMVKKDVLRTDRHLQFFAGNDDNINVVSLFNILTTFALNHPSVGYCQGMSDLVSPLLYVLQNEAQAYLAFCGLMQRLKPNFTMDGIAMTAKFQHLTDALQFYDPVFYDYLKSRQADDLLFCYRWLLLELKREFAFDDALRMLEVLWSSLPPDCPCATQGLSLFEQKYTGLVPPTVTTPGNAGNAGSSGKKPTLSSLRRRTTAYSKVCAIRRQSSGSVSLGNSPLLKKEFSSEGAVTGMSASKRVQSLDGIASGAGGGGGSSGRGSAARGRAHSDEDRQARKERLLRERRLQSESELPSPPGGRKIRDLAEFRRLTRQPAAAGLTLELLPAGGEPGPEATPPEKAASPPATLASETPSPASEECELGALDCPATAEMRRQREQLERSTSCFIEHAADAVDIYENPIPEEEPPEVGSAAALPPAGDQSDGSVSSVGYSSEPVVVARATLPPPQEFGGGNPFLIFLSLSLLLQHRDQILQRRLDYQDVAMLFDKMVRKHDVIRTLEMARKMFTEYLKRDWSVAPSSCGETSASNGADVGV